MLKHIIMPVIIGVIAMIKKEIEKFLNKIPGKPSLEEVQKIAVDSPCIPVNSVDIDTDRTWRIKCHVAFVHFLFLC